MRKRNKEKEQELGVNLIHLNGKWAYGSVTGTKMSKFEFDDKQIQALKKFLEEGPFDGMFTTVGHNHYRNILAMKYNSLQIKMPSFDRVNELEIELKKQEKALNDAYEKYIAQNESQPQ